MANNILLVQGGRRRHLPRSSFHGLQLTQSLKLFFSDESPDTRKRVSVLFLSQCCARSLMTTAAETELERWAPYSGGYVSPLRESSRQ